MKIVRSGVWFYDNKTEMPVDIIAIDYDWWYEMAAEEGDLDPGEQPGPFDESGLIYYVRFKYAGMQNQIHWVDSGGYTSIHDAIAEATSKVQSEIRWST